MADATPGSVSIEYLVRAGEGHSDWDLWIDDAGVLIPRNIDCRQMPGEPGLTVRKELWQVTYSPEDPGWQLSFSEYTTQIEAWQFSSAVAAQLEGSTGIPTRLVQIAGFDGGIFECHRTHGLKSRNCVVFEGSVVSGEIDDSMNLHLHMNAIGGQRLELNSIDYVDRADPGTSDVGLICQCEDWEDVEALLKLDISNQLFEVSSRVGDGIVEQRAAVREVVEPHSDLVREISALLFVQDPMGINYDTNTDEYDPEARTIVLRLLDLRELTNVRVLQVVHEEFIRWFSAANAGPMQRYEEIARQIAPVAEAARGRSEGRVDD